MTAAALLERLQPLGRALMLPIAVLPIAALLLRLGQPDLLALPFVAAAGQAIFDHLGLLFAAGVAVGLARENHGAAALAGIVCYLVATEGARPLLDVAPGALTAADATLRELQAAAWRAREIAKLSVPVGLISGVLAGLLYNRFYTIRLPDYLGFFGGRRFVPIVAGLAGVALAALFGRGFPLFEASIDGLSRWVVAAGPVGVFSYGVLNRLLLVTGLHHILNNLAWFVVGDFHGTTGDLKRFFAGDPGAGVFMSGHFATIMFGLPAACLAMYRAAPPERRRSVAGLYLGLALTSFVTGVTEPVEFTFMFLAPLLFVFHAIMNGIAMVVMDVLGVRLGFGFSAGLVDYVLNFALATRPLMLLPVGAAYFTTYYVVFAWAIRRFDIRTPGRDAPRGVAAFDEAASDDRAGDFVAALGGRDNLVTIDACTTRLRLVVADAATIDRDRLAALGARGVLDLGRGRVQVVVGPEADQLAAAMRIGPGFSRPPAAEAAPASSTETELTALLRGHGARDATARGHRLIVALPRDVDPATLKRLAEVRDAVRLGDAVHIFTTEPCASIAEQIRQPAA